MAHKNLPIVDWLQIEASAPAKFIISGEYSVVYDKQAIAAAIDLRTRVTVRPNQTEEVRLNMKNLNNTRVWPINSFNMFRLVSKYSDCLEFTDSMPAKLNHLLHTKFRRPTNPSAGQECDNVISDNVAKQADDAAMAFLLLYIGLGDSYASSGRPPIDVDIESSIPVGAGLGSSSALSVALCGALMRVFRVVAEKYIISNWAFNIDKFFHGKPSGVDNSTITTGGYILFQTGKIKGIGQEHKAPIKVMLIDTGVSRSTRALSENVIMQLRENPTKVNNIFSNINQLTTQIWSRINDPNFCPRSLYGFLSENQELLDSLGVGHERISSIKHLAQGYDLVAKQTGAGGGGIAFVMYDDSDCAQVNSISHFRHGLNEKGYKFQELSIGCEGLIVDITPDPNRKFVLGNK